MARFGRIFYNILTGLGFAAVFLLIFLKKGGYSDLLPSWERWGSIAALVVAGLGIVFMGFSIIFFFRRVKGMIFSHIFFVLMLLDVTYAALIYTQVIGG